MNSIFPDPIRGLPEADIPIDGLSAYLLQAADHQLVFMEFARDVVLPEHAHAAQVGFVLSGTIDVNINGDIVKLGKGDIYSVPAGVKHSGKVYAGYSDITFFAEADRYKAKEG